jgi:4-carboxymuconolactone decarboxylase
MDTARHPHDQPVRSQFSQQGNRPLQETDPELVDHFGRFAFGEVPDRARLDPHLTWLVRLAALVACQAHQQYSVTLKVALDEGVSPVEAKELLYQAVAYLGMGKIVEFLHLTNDELDERGVPLPLPPQSTTTIATRFEKGWDAQFAIIGERLRSLHEDAPADEVHLQRWLTENCFGDHYTRGGIDLRTRELLTFVLLVAHGGCDPQVASHVAGNLRMGNGRAVLIDTLSLLVPWIGYPRMLNGLRAVDEVASPGTE